MCQQAAQGRRGWAKVLVLLLVLGLPLQMVAQPGVANPDVTLPSTELPTLHWATQRFGLGMIEDWRIRRQGRLVKVRVSERWYRLPYFDRYRMVTGLGTAAARHNYRLVLLSTDNRVLATYDCTEVEGDRHCEIDLNPLPNPL